MGDPRTTVQCKKCGNLIYTSEDQKQEVQFFSEVIGCKRCEQCAAYDLIRKMAVLLRECLKSNGEVICSEKRVDDFSKVVGEADIALLGYKRMGVTSLKLRRRVF